MQAAGTVLDCLVIGAGPGGLTAATYLLRFHRRVGVIDAGRSRARWIPTSHNAPGFPHGVTGRRLLELQREQAIGYGAEIESGRISRLERSREDGAVLFTATAADGRRWQARHVILATGIEDVMPPLDGLEEAIAAGAVRLCAVCDGYEASDSRVAVFGVPDDSIGHALFLRTFSREVSLLASSGVPSGATAELAREAGVEILPAPHSLAYEGDAVLARFGEGQRRFDTLYPALGSRCNSGLAQQLGARCDGTGAVQVDAHARTGVDGLYAIGDVVSALNQIAVAVGHAALAATDIHNRLPANWRERPELQAATAPHLPSPDGHG